MVNAHDLMLLPVSSSGEPALKRFVSRVSEKLDEVLAKIKMKQQEQANDDRFDKQLAELDKKAAIANRSRGTGKGGAGAVGATKDDPYSRKRTVEKVYWSTGQRNTVSSITKEVIQVQAEQVCYARTGAEYVNRT